MQSTQRDTVWILGGTGVVGQNLLRLLRAQELDRVMTVSRRPLLDGTAHLARNLADSRSDFPCTRGDIVVNLTEQTSAELVGTVLQRGACFIESSASPDYMMAIREMARSVRGPGFLVDGCGVAPGLTNLLAYQVLQTHPDTRALEIVVDLGLGKHAGKAALTWFIRSLARPYTAKVEGAWQVLSPADTEIRVQWRQGDQLSLALGFPFTEQQILAEELGPACDTVQCFLSMRPGWVTQLFKRLLGLGAGNFLSSRADLSARFLLRLPSFGPVSTRLQVLGRNGAGHETGTMTLSCGDQSEATAAVLARTVLAARQFSGVGPICPLPELLSLEQAFEAIHKVHHDASFRHTSPTILA